MAHYLDFFLVQPQVVNVSGPAIAHGRTLAHYLAVHLGRLWEEEDAHPHRSRTCNLRQTQR